MSATATAEATKAATLDLQPGDILLHLIVTLLAPMFLAVCCGNLDFARMAALETVNAYRARSHVDLIAVAQIVAHGLASVSSACLSMAEDISLLMTPRLRASANASNRACDRARRTLEANRAAPAPDPVFAPDHTPTRDLAPDPEADRKDAEVIARLAVVRRQGEALLARHAAAAPTPAAPTPAAIVDQPAVPAVDQPAVPAADQPAVPAADQPAVPAAAILTPAIPTPAKIAGQAPIPAAGAPTPATPTPATPTPATPIPATPIPATPIPATPIPATPIPATPIPATPISATPISATPIPGASAPHPATLAAKTPRQTTPTPAPTAGEPSAEQFQHLWGAAMTVVANEYSASMAHLPPAERDAARARADVLTKAAADLFAGNVPPRLRAGDLGSPTPPYR